MKGKALWNNAYLGKYQPRLLTGTKHQLQYRLRGTFINPLTPVVRIIHARSNTAAEHPLILVVMTLAFRDDRTRGFAVDAREGSSRSAVFLSST